jgi:predicted metalloprotease with PDZ domain
VCAQNFRVLIRVVPESNRVIVEGSFIPTKVWSFRDSYAGILGLGARVERLKLFDNAAAEIPYRKIAPGQFASEASASRFQYEVRLAPSAAASDAVKVSWLNNERGLLMLGDLLPTASVTTDDQREKGRMAIRFELPASWSVHSNENETRPSNFEVVDLDHALFVAGSRLRVSRTTVSGMAFNLVADGNWAFADTDASELAAKVLKAHRDVFGSMPAKQSTLILLPFQGLSADRWSAETRGSTVTLLMGQIPSKVAALVRLSTPLTHELFHLWVPNGLALNDDYDWFYEGFTVYQAARTAVRLDLLTFPEFLNAIARAYDGYVAGVDHDRWSLVEASQRRWTVGESSVYSKSMVVAFLYDLKLQSQSHGKHSLDDVYRKLFQRYRSSDPASSTLTNEGAGNEAVMNVLAGESMSQDFVQMFIRNPVVINLPAELAPFGLRAEKFGARTSISVSEQLTKRQRDLLRGLGYNDYVRHQRRGI